MRRKFLKVFRSRGVLGRRKTRVGVYVDAFNLYYGAREHCGRGTPGWRWLDLESLATELTSHSKWQNAEVTRIVYCTAIRENDVDESSVLDQRMYLDALNQNPKISIEYGHYQPRHGKGVLVKQGRRRNYTRIIRESHMLVPDWLPATDFLGPEGKTNLLISYSSFEEKGSDVNLGSHLLIDVLSSRVDAAIVVTNDGDLRFPLSYAREIIPIGLVNPNTKDTSFYLRDNENVGVGSHWWRRLDKGTLMRNQLPPEVGQARKPASW